MIDRVRTPMALINQSSAFLGTLRERRRDRSYQLVREDERIVAVLVDVTEPERIVSGLSKHPAFVGRENATVIIIHQRAKAGAGRTAQVYVTNRPVRKHPRENQRRIKLSKWSASPIDLQNPAQPALIEAQPLLRIIFRELLRLDGKAERGKRPQEDAVQPKLKIFVNDIIDAI